MPKHLIFSTLEEVILMTFQGKELTPSCMIFWLEGLSCPQKDG